MSSGAGVGVTFLGTGAGVEKSDSDHLCSEVGPDPDCRSRLRQNSAFFFRTRCQAKFLTGYCFSVILLLRVRAINFGNYFLMSVV